LLLLSSTYTPCVARGLVVGGMVVGFLYVNVKKAYYHHHNQTPSITRDEGGGF